MPTHEELSLRGRAGAHARLALYDPKTLTSAATAAWLARWEREVDPEFVLSPEERQRRAKHALKSHMAILALKSTRDRRRRAEEAEAAELMAMAVQVGEATHHSPKSNNQQIGAAGTVIPAAQREGV